MEGNDTFGTLWNAFTQGNRSTLEEQHRSIVITYHRSTYIYVHRSIRSHMMKSQIKRFHFPEYLLFTT